MRILILPLLLIATGVSAQTAPGGLGGLLGSAGLPNIGSVGAGNAAGVLGYCVKNKLATGGAASVLGKLTGQPGVATSPGFSAGQAGRLQTGKTSLSLDSLRGQVKTRVCDMVLKRAQSFL